MSSNDTKIEIKRIKDVMVQDYNGCNIKTLYCDIEYIDFFENFMLRNWPCIIKNVSSKWDCSNKWIKNDSINYDYFINKYGDLEAPIADCSNITFNSQCKTEMKVRDFMQYLKNSKKAKLLYLKDWHLRKSQPNDIFYEIPPVFASDWLNEFAQDQQIDDFMFVYIGPKDSWTPLHADVYYSYSWSVNVVGSKKWILFPPGEEDKLKDSLGNLPLLFKPELYENIKYFEINQEKGDAIFVPSGWYHQVVNQLETISINHNWVNACNIETVWKALQKNLSSVENEIKEFKDTPEFNSQCQLILKSIFGMDYTDFVNFLCYIAQKRLVQLQTGNHSGFNNFILGINHILFDLYNILKTMNLIHDHPLFFSNHLFNINYDFSNIKSTISNILLKY